MRFAVYFQSAFRNENQAGALREQGPGEYLLSFLAVP